MLKSASKPIAVLLAPVVRLKRAPLPSAVLPLPKSPSGVGVGVGVGVGLGFACAVGESAKQAKASATESKPYRKGGWLIKFVTGRVFIFVFSFC